jgi:hypothetical protein
MNEEKEKKEKKEIKEKNQLKVPKKIDKNKHLPKDYTGTFIVYLDAQGHPLETEEGAVLAIVNEFKLGQRVQEVFVTLRPGGTETERGKEESRDAGKTPSSRKAGDEAKKTSNTIRRS